MALILATTGAVVIQVTIARKDLALTREASEEAALAAFPQDYTDDKATRKAKKRTRREFVDARQGFKYVFIKKFSTNYVLGESAAHDLALKILHHFMGPEAMAGGLASTTNVAPNADTSGYLEFLEGLFSASFFPFSLWSWSSAAPCT